MTVAPARRLSAKPYLKPHSRKERAAAMRRAVLRMPLGEPDGMDIAAEIARNREDDR